MGIGDRHAGTVRAVPVPETAAARPVRFAGSNADPETEKFTDENRAYNGLENHHMPFGHGDGGYVRGEAHANGTGSLRVPARRGYDGTLRHIEPRHPHRHIRRVCGAAGRQGGRRRRKDGQHCTEFGGQEAHPQAAGGLQVPVRRAIVAARRFRQACARRPFQKDQRRGAA